MLSKSFDNGMICASEQAVIVEEEIREEFEKLMWEAGCYFVNDEEKEKLKNSMFDSENGYKLKSHIPGQSPFTIAQNAGFSVPEKTKVLVVREYGVGEGYPFSKEKLSPVLTYYTVPNVDEGIEKAEALIEYGGMGHSAVIHSESKENILKFSKRMKARKNYCKFAIYTWCNWRYIQHKHAITNTWLWLIWWKLNNSKCIFSKLNKYKKSCKMEG